MRPKFDAVSRGKGIVDTRPAPRFDLGDCLADDGRLKKGDLTAVFRLGEGPERPSSPI